MELNLTRPIIFFDIESTGLDIANDRIIELSMVKIHPNQKRETVYYLLNPGMPIPPVASAVHGITDEQVANSPKFKEVAEEIFNFMENCDLGGFNSNRFDVPMLQEEMLRCNYDISVENRNSIDVQVIFHTMEKRTLEAAYNFYCNKTLENAHSAEADTLATLEVFMAQIEKYPEVENDIPRVAEKFSNSSSYVDNQRRITYDGKDYLLNFGKYKGKTFQEISKSDPGYFQWMYRADFGLHTKYKLKEICENLGIQIN